jgi:hypothetical protein
MNPEGSAKAAVAGAGVAVLALLVALTWDGGRRPAPEAPAAPRTTYEVEAYLDDEALELVRSGSVDGVAVDVTLRSPTATVQVRGHGLAGLQDGQLQRRTFRQTFTAAVDEPFLTARNLGPLGTITCRIRRGDVVLAEGEARQEYGTATCSP